MKRNPTSEFKPRTQPSTFQVIDTAKFILEHQLSVDDFFNLCDQITPRIVDLDASLSDEIKWESVAHSQYLRCASATDQANGVVPGTTEAQG
jgi:hypothetical protein